MIAALVAAVWAISMVADMILGPKYDPNPFVHGAFMLVLGSIFGSAVVRK